MTPAAPSRLVRLTRAALPVAPLALGAIPSAQAVIVYTNVNITFAASDGKSLYVDMGTGGATGAAALGIPGPPFASPTFYLFFRGSNSTRPEWASNSTSTFDGDNQVVRNSSNNTVLNLANGTLISGASLLGGNYSRINTNTFLNDSQWAAGTTGYIGVRFDTTTTPLFGWVQISYNANLTLTVHDFAYESSGGSILAGAGAVPEPSTYAMMAGLLAGSAALYRRRQQKKDAA